MFLHFLHMIHILFHQILRNIHLHNHQLLQYLQLIHNQLKLFLKQLDLQNLHIRYKQLLILAMFTNILKHIKFQLYQIYIIQYNLHNQNMLLNLNIYQMRIQSLQLYQLNLHNIHRYQRHYKQYILLYLNNNLQYKIELQEQFHLRHQYLI